jgi:hypothetical protein
MIFYYFAELSEAVQSLPDALKGSKNPPLLVDCLLEVFHAEDAGHVR